MPDHPWSHKKSPGLRQGHLHGYCSTIQSLPCVISLYSYAFFRMAVLKAIDDFFNLLIVAEMNSQINTAFRKKSRNILQKFGDATFEDERSVDVGSR